MKECQQGEVVMDTLNFEVLQAIVGYLYGNGLSLDGTQMQYAVEVCTMLQLNELKDKLTTYIKKHITVENCIGWWRFADLYSLQDVGRKARELMMTRLEVMSACDEFKALSLAELLDYIIKAEDIHLHNRDTILMASLEWFNFDPAPRTADMLNMLKQVRLEECTSAAIKVLAGQYKHLITLRCQELYI